MKVADIEQKVDEILDRYQFHQGFLVSMLQDIQAEYRYLPKEVLVEVSQYLGIPLIRVYSVATFLRPSV